MACSQRPILAALGENGRMEGGERGVGERRREEEEEMRARRGPERDASHGQVRALKFNIIITVFSRHFDSYGEHSLGNALFNHKCDRLEVSCRSCMILMRMNYEPSLLPSFHSLDPPFPSRFQFPRFRFRGKEKTLSAVQSPRRLPHLELLCGQLDGSFHAGGRLRPKRGNMLVDEFPELTGKSEDNTVFSGILDTSKRCDSSYRDHHLDYTLSYPILRTEYKNTS